MTQVSKYPLNKEVEERIFEVFWQTIADLKTPWSVKKFFHDLLYPTEKVMLAKRLAIAILITKGYDYRSICQILKVTLPTVWTVNIWLKQGGEGYKMAIEKILKQEKSEEFWQKISDFVKEATDAKRKYPTTYHPPKSQI